jgi:hypothetical protein
MALLGSLSGNYEIRGSGEYLKQKCQTILPGISNILFQQFNPLLLPEPVTVCQLILPVK